MGGAGAHALSARPPALQRAGVCASRGQGRSSPLPRPLPPALGPRHFRTLRPCQHVDDSASRASAPSAPEASEHAGPVGRRNATGDGRGAAFLHSEGLRPLAAAWAGASTRTLARVSGLEQSEARALAALRRRAVAVRAESGARTPAARHGAATLRRTAPPRGDLQAGGAGAEHHLPGWPVRHGALSSVT